MKNNLRPTLGAFVGQVAFGGAFLSNRGSTALLAAKYVPASGTWAGTQSGINTEEGLNVIVSETIVVIGGHLTPGATGSRTIGTIVGSQLNVHLTTRPVLNTGLLPGK